MSDDIDPAIMKLEQALEELERKANGLRQAINVLCETAGRPPRYPDGGGGSDGGQKLTSIGPGTFYGKKQQTAVREFLEMRKRSLGIGSAPATPREIYDALKQGGYVFEAKDDEIALVGLRALLRKRSMYFHKLPNGSYGLTEWYENIKTPKAAADEGDDDETPESETAEAKEPKAKAKAA